MCRRSIGLIILLGVLGLATTASADLVGHWWLNDGSGTTAADSSGNGNNGTLIGGPQWAEQGLAFDGVDDWVDIGNPDQLPDGASPRSICAWAMTQSTAGGWRVVVGYGSPAGSQSNGFAQNGTLLSGFGYGNDLTLDGFFEIGVWYHLCLTYDGTTAIVYANGAEIMSQAKDWNLVRGFARIGRQVNNAAEFWNGAIYDVRIYDHALTVPEILAAMAGSPELSTDPSPEDEAIDIPRDVVLAWEAGKFADTHDVYFGTSQDDVNDASRANSLGVLASQEQVAKTFDPEGVLEYGQTYYWRVDEVNAAPDKTVFKGNVWSFTVEPLAYPIENVAATSNGVSEATAGPENTVNGSGLNGDDQHSTESTDMWVASPNGADPLQIEFAFDRIYKLHQMLVWNYNVQFELLLGFGVKTATVEYSENGSDWAVLGEVELAQGTAASGYEANTTVELNGVAARRVRLTVNSGFGMMGQFGLSEVRFLSIPVQAREPQPTNGAADVSIAATLAWRAGREAASHDVYLSTDETAVADNSALIETTSETTVDPDVLEMGVTYYWKVNEVNQADAISTWEGDLWNFSTQAYLIVDGFESYDDEDNRIYDTWIDGYNVAGNGSQVGHIESPFAEQTIVKSGSQSMPLFYDNAGAATSEAELALAGEDWTANGIRTLSLSFRGVADNDGQLYVKINGTKVAYDGDSSDIARAVWQPWNIDLSAVSGNLSNVTSLTIGVEGAGAQGVVYIDDVRLYPDAVEYITPTEPAAAGLLAHYALDGNANDGSGHGYNGVAEGDITYRDGVLGSAADFDGIDSLIDCGDVPVGQAGGISVALWINPRNINQDWAGYVSKWTLDDTERTFWLGQHATDGWLRFSIYPGGPTAETALDSGQAILADGEWTHLVCTYDGNIQKIYAEGAEIVASAPREAALVDRGGNLRFGIVAAANFFDGLADDIRIYDHALSDGEAAWLAGKRAPIHKPF